MIASHATLLTPAQVGRVHDASLEILAEVGILVRNDKARRRFAAHGCKVDTDTSIVRLPPRVVEHFRALVPSKFTFHGREAGFDRTIPDDGPLIATASSAPNVIDPVSGEERRGLSVDIARIAHLVNELEGFDVFSVSTLADDAPAGQFSLSRFYPALKNTLKPVRTSVTDEKEARQIMKLGEMIAGGGEAYRERPFITHGYCSIVSPLVMDRDSTEMLMFYAERQIPAYGAIAPIGGLCAPLSLTGMLAMTNAEWLAAAVLAQMSRPATPLLAIFLPVVADMRTGAYAPGGIETSIMDIALSQMARFYGVPSGGYMGQTNAKAGDAQAGFEKGMSSLAGVLGGSGLLVMGGLLDALMTFDYGQLVIDNEIALMVKRLARGIEFGAEELALEAIAEVGPGGMFIDHPHTVERMRTTAFLPQIAERDSRGTWLEKGALDTHARAMVRVREILSGDNPAVFSAEVDGRVRDAFEGLVAGSSTLPEGWESTSGEPARRRRGRRRGGRGGAE